MAKIIFQTGNTPTLTTAELAAVFQQTPESVGPYPSLSIPKQLVRNTFDILGGSVRAFEEKGTGNEISDIIEICLEDIQKNRTEGRKMRIGLFFPSPKHFKKYFKPLHQDIKEFTKENSISLRITNRGPQPLDSDAVYREKLLEEGNAEYGFLYTGEHWVLLKTLCVQHIRPFIVRDTKKPIRDMKVGMIPPKLARILINISRDDTGELPDKIYDPFCGTGTVLLEALDMGRKIAGSDLMLAQAEATKKNALWFYNKGKTKDEISTQPDPFFIKDIFKKDATVPYEAIHSKILKNTVIVAEGYLGKIFGHSISEPQFETQRDELVPLYRKFIFEASKMDIKKIVFAFPFWQGKKENTFHMTAPIVEMAEKIGFTVSAPLFYKREQQVVGREILVFTKEDTKVSSDKEV